jgi:serine phosphatase RsbU (regulator of sigma subunit)
MAIVSPETNEISVVNAGHMAPMVRRASGEIDEVGEQIAGLPVGVVDHYEYQQHTLSLGPGEMVALYTDGINESTNGEGKQYTIDRIRQMVRQTAEDAEVLGDNIITDLRRFIGGHDQGDDMCLVCFGRDWPTPAQGHPGATAVMK